MNAAQRQAFGETAAATLSVLGAPELPARHIYRVKQDPHSDHVVIVEVRKLGARVGSDRLSWSTFSTRQGEPATDALVRACNEAYADAFPNGAPA
jgi:hypothetical protein